jgi:hypothetical protein
MLLRTLAVLLLLANLVFFGWARGWWAPMWPAPRQGEREPERLAAQVLPESVVVVPLVAGSSGARSSAPQCLEAGPLEEAGLAAGEAALAAAQLPEGSWSRIASTPAPTWLVYAGRVPTQDARQVAEAELRKNGLAFDVINEPAELAPGLVLSRHNTRALADAAVAQVQAQVAANAQGGLRGLRVVALPTPPAQYWLRAEKADLLVQARLNAIPPQDAKDALAGGFRACAVRP